MANPRDAASFEAHWVKVLSDPAITARAILADDVLVGQVSCFQIEGHPWVGYWLAREHWEEAVLVLR